MNQRAIRGATTVNADDNALVIEATQELLARIVNDNQVDLADIVSVIFTVTPDIRSVFPPVAARQMGWSDVPLLTCQEMDCVTGLRYCIRVLLTYNTDKTQPQIHHVYLREATQLRPDLVKGAL